MLGGLKPQRGGSEIIRDLKWRIFTVKVLISGQQQSFRAIHDYKAAWD